MLFRLAAQITYQQMSSFYYGMVFSSQAQSFLSLYLSPFIHRSFTFSYRPLLLQSTLRGPHRAKVLGEPEMWGREDAGTEHSLFRAVSSVWTIHRTFPTVCRGQGWELQTRGWGKSSLFTNLGGVAAQNPSSFLPHTHLYISRKRVGERKIQWLVSVLDSSRFYLGIWEILSLWLSFQSMPFLFGGKQRLSTIFL